MAHIGGESFAVHDAVAEQKAPHEHVETLHEHLANTRRAEQPQRHRNVLPRPVEGIEDEQARYSLRVRDRPRQPDRPAPVLHDDHCVAQIERFEQRLQARHMPRDPVELWIGRLVRAAEPKMVGRDRTVARRCQRADEVPVQKAPGRVAVHQHDRAAFARPLVDVVHPPVGRLKPARLKQPQPPESPVRRHSWQNSRGRAEPIKDARTGSSMRLA